MPELEVKNLSKRYGKTVAVDDLSFSVEAGQVTGFLGPNGAGKTTTMRALLGLVRPRPRRSAPCMASPKRPKKASGRSPVGWCSPPGQPASSWSAPC